MRLVLRPWLLEWQKQHNNTYFRNVIRTTERISLSNIFQTSQQHCCQTAARMLQVSKAVVPTSQQVLISRFVSPYLEYKQIVFRRRDFVCMLRMKQRTLHLMISLFIFSKEHLTLPQTQISNLLRVQLDMIFQLKLQLLP